MWRYAPAAIPRPPALLADCGLVASVPLRLAFSGATSCSAHTWGSRAVWSHHRACRLLILYSEPVLDEQDGDGRNQALSAKEELSAVVTIPLVGESCRKSRLRQYLVRAQLLEKQDRTNTEKAIALESLGGKCGEQKCCGRGCGDGTREIEMGGGEEKGDVVNDENEAMGQMHADVWAGAYNAVGAARVVGGKAVVMEHVCMARGSMSLSTCWDLSSLSCHLQGIQTV